MRICHAALRRSCGTWGHDVHTPDDENLGGADDDAIWEAAQREQRFIITQDLDFSDMAQRQLAYPDLEGRFRGKPEPSLRQPHYGMTEEEFDFVRNFEIKFRMGWDVDEEDTGKVNRN
jgi:hypothetical protein